MKLYAALHDDAADGFVWLKKDGLPPHSVVRITNRDNRRRIFCEALQIDDNFLAIYNQSPRIKLLYADSSIVMNYWYRARLGAVETQKEYPLVIAPANSWWGHLRAGLSHPQAAVRVAVSLGLWSVLLTVMFGMMTFGPGIAGSIAARALTQPEPKVAYTTLSVDDVLAWRNTFGDLLGKSRQAVIERYGAPQKEDGASLSWDQGPRTGGRFVLVGFESAPGGVVQVMKVGALSTERFDTTEVLKKAPMFTFETGTYKDTLVHYFTASTKDGRNGFQFDITQSGPKFSYAIFAKDGALSDK